MWAGNYRPTTHYTKSGVKFLDRVIHYKSLKISLHIIHIEEMSIIAKTKLIRR